MNDAAETLLQESYQIADGTTRKIGTTDHVTALVIELRAALGVIDCLKQALILAKGGRE